MKKVIVIVVLLALLITPMLLPMPLFTSGFVAQYALGERIEFGVSAWNLSPLPREIKEEGATSVILKVDGQPLASTATSASPRLSPFGRVEQKLEYIISDEEVSNPAFDPHTGYIKLPPGTHKISVEWLGGSSLGSEIRVVDL